MRKNFGPNPLSYPQPVFIIAAWGEDGTPNCMNAAWGGISDDHEVSVCISAGHKTTANIRFSRAFTISMATADQLIACDYVGITSGNRVPDKFARAGFHATASQFVNAPLIDELPMAMECELISYDVSADESILNENGKVDPAKLRPITFDPMNNTYVVLGEMVGQAFKDGAKLK